MTLESASSKVHAALSAIIQEEQASIVTKWIALVEIIDENGVPQIWSLTSAELSMWDCIGMVEFQSRSLQPEVGP